MKTNALKRCFPLLVAITIITLLAGCAGSATQIPTVSGPVNTEPVVASPTTPPVQVSTPTTAPAANTTTTAAANNGEPTIYRAVLRPATKNWHIGYTDGGSTFDVSKIRWKSIQDAAAVAGVTLVYCDNAYPDLQAPILCAEQMVTQKVDLVISSNWTGDLNSRISEIYKAANIPFIAWDVTSPGSRSYYGIDTWTAGTIAGDYAGKWALTNCQIDQVDIVLMTNPAVGSFPLMKLSGFEAGVRSWLPGIPPERVYTISGGSTADEGLSSMDAWLTAHPDSHCVLVTAINNAGASGASAAFTTSGRVKDGCIVGQGADAPMFTEFVTPETNSAYKASVSDSPWKDGNALIPMAVDILEGVNVPPISLKVHEIITRENINDTVPTQYQIWP
jgi:ABC-type sugar transport system substrate-binding protein